jgi:hypothetical protein
MENSKHSLLTGEPILYLTTNTGKKQALGKNFIFQVQNALKSITKMILLPESGNFIMQMGNYKKKLLALKMLKMVIKKYLQKTAKCLKNTLVRLAKNMDFLNSTTPVAT